MSTKYFLKRIYSPPTQYGSASSYGSVLEPFLQDPTLCLLIPFSKVFLSIQALYSTEFRRDLVVVMFINARLLSHRLLCPRDSPGKNTRVGCHALQGIFLTQGSNPHVLRLLHWQAGSFTTSAISNTFAQSQMLLNPQFPSSNPP